MAIVENNFEEYCDSISSYLRDGLYFDYHIRQNDIDYLLEKYKDDTQDRYNKGQSSEDTGYELFTALALSNRW